MVELVMNTFDPTATTNTVQIMGVVVTGVGGSPAINSYWPTSGGGMGYLTDGLEPSQVPNSNIQ